jgi:hypothetical protein
MTQTDDDILKEKLQALELKAQTPGAGQRVELTEHDYQTWRKAHDERIFEKKRKAVEERHKKNLFTGRELIEKGACEPHERGFPGYPASKCF